MHVDKMKCTTPTPCTALGARLSTMLAALAAFVLLALAAAASPIDSFYPALVHPDAAVHPAYDAVPRGQRGQTRQGAGDGSYQYCSMPHPAHGTYREPAPVANGSVHARLVGVYYVQRHQKRTTYHVFPNGESTRYECDDMRPYLYAGGGRGVPAPLPVYARTYYEGENPLMQTFTNSTCQFPQLTLGGYLDGVQHGQELRCVYGERYGVLPRVPSPEHVWLRSSSAALTQDTAGGVLRGLWPHHNGPLPLHQQAEDVDTHGTFSCDRRDALKKKAESTSEWKAFMKATQPLQKRLVSMLRTNESDWNSDWDHYCDNFQARLCNGYPLPCAHDDPHKCVTTAEARQTFAAGDWMYNYLWVRQKYAKELIRLTSGLLIRDTLRQLREIASGHSKRSYVHLFMHDGDIAPLAASLGIQTLRWPGMGSNIALELWNAGGSHYVRVLYSGLPIRSTHGDLEWMELHKFAQMWSDYVPKDVVSECKSS